MSKIREPFYYSIHTPPLVCPLEEEMGKKVEYTTTDKISCTKETLLHEMNKDVDASFPYEMSLQTVSILFLLMSSLCLIFIMFLLIRMAQKVNEVNSLERDVVLKVEKEKENEKTEEIKEIVNIASIKKNETESIKENHQNSPSLLFGLGDNNYVKACRLSEMIIVFVNNYMNEWYKKVMTDEDVDVKRWHPYLLTNDIEISGFIMVRIMNSRIEYISKGMMEYIAVILSSAIFHALLKGPKRIMKDLEALYTVRLPTNCYSIYKIKQIRSYGESTLKKAYENHISEVQRNADEKTKMSYFDNLPEMDKIKAYNDEMKKLILQILAEINWKVVLKALSNKYAGIDEEDNESDYCISPRRGESTEKFNENRQSYL